MHVWRITLIISCCHILTGTAAVVTRYLVSVLEPVEIAFVRYFLGGLAMLPLYYVYRRGRFHWTLLIRILGLGVLFFALFPFLFSWSYVYTTAARGALVLATMPIWTMLITKALGHEKLNRLQLLATGLTLLGLAIALADKLFAVSDSGVHFKGEFIMLLATFVGAVYATYARRLLDVVPAGVMTPIAMLAGCMCLGPFVVAGGGIGQHVTALSTMHLVLIVYLGIIAGGIAFFLFNWALNKSSATYTSLFVTLNPITAVFLGHLFLGEVTGAGFVVGVVVIFAGLGVAVRSSRHSLKTVRQQK